MAALARPRVDGPMVVLEERMMDLEHGDDANCRPSTCSVSPHCHSSLACTYRLIYSLHVILSFSFYIFT